MDWTVVVILAIIALATVLSGLVLSRRPTVNKMTTVDPELFPLRSNVRSLSPQSITSDVLVAGPELHYDDKVWVTKGLHQGMYGHIRSRSIDDEYLVSFPAQDGKPFTSAWYHPKSLTTVKPQSLPILPYTGEGYDSTPFGLKRIDRNKSLPLIDPSVPPFPELPPLDNVINAKRGRSLNQLLFSMGQQPVKGGEQSTEALFGPEQDPPQSVSGIIPFGQAAGDYPDPEAGYEKMEMAPPDWRQR